MVIWLLDDFIFLIALRLQVLLFFRLLCADRLFWLSLGSGSLTVLVLALIDLRLLTGESFKGHLIVDFHFFFDFLSGWLFLVFSLLRFERGKALHLCLSSSLLLALLLGGLAT